jgi:phosphoribosylformylglycinamidine synthase
MASKGGVGIRLDMDAVPCRETGMTPYEMMLSESQERMLMVLKPGREAEAEAIFKKWELDFAVIGTVTDTGRMELVWKGEIVADIPLGPLADEAPLYDRPSLSPDEYRAWAKVKPLGEVPESSDIAGDLLKLMGSPALASRRWIWEQYDQQVGGDTVQKPGGDAAVVRVHGSDKALAITTDCTPRYCYADPYEGGKQAIAEAYRNLSAVGATPLAVTNCLNFANPQRPEIMAQITGCLAGMADACRALDFPIVSGNVSLYNESKATGGGSAILPTPAIGGVGLLPDWSKSASIAFKAEGETIVLVGVTRQDGMGHLGQSLWARDIGGLEGGAPPEVDLEHERAVATLVRDLIARDMVTAVHDVADGGVAVAIAEMALAGDLGAEVLLWKPFVSDAFGEDQGLFVVTVRDDEGLEALDALEQACEEAGVSCAIVGVTGGDTIKFVDVEEWEADRFDGLSEVSLSELRSAHEAFLPDLMGADGALA